MSDHLFLAIDEAPLVCRIHPVVIFTILDHHNRRKSDQTCVIGSLLGSVSDNVIEVKSAFGIPHNESNEELNVDMDYHNTMLKLHLRANPNETLVGWYSSASIVDRNSVLIHDIFWEEMGSSPVHLTVDSELYGGRMEIQPYVTEKLMGQNENLPAGQQFFPIAYELETADTEYGCLATLMKSKQNELRTKIDTESQNLEQSLKTLLNMLDVASNYVDDVVEGKQQGDNNIGRILASCVAGLPQINTGEFDELFEKSVQDKLTVVYLASLTRTQLALAERLHM